MASLYAEISAKTDGFTSGLSSAKSQLGGFGSALSSFAGIAAAAFGGAAIAAVAFSKALEFGEQAAQIDQVTSSFNTLTSSLGAAPDLLDKLTAATRGTVTELDLMASTTQMLTGTSGALGAALADAAPQLAAIAQAAHDLNPTMGTTAEMYDRLSRGIKKAEPELLDEVGILMNLTQVYKSFADSLGKPVTELTKAEKTQAMLNAVLQEGSTIVEQAKGVNTSYSDSISQMQTSMENAGNAMKEKFAPAVAAVADAITKVLTLSSSMGDQERQIYATSSSYEEYSSAVKELAASLGFTVNANGDLIGSGGMVVKTNYMMSSSSYEASKASDALTASVSATSSALDDYAGRAAAANTETYNAEAAMSAYSDRLTGLAKEYKEVEAAEAARAQAAILQASITGTVGNATEQYTATIADLVQQEYELADAIAEATTKYGENSTQVQELSQAMAENQAAQAGALAALQATTAQMMYQQAAAGLDTQASLDLARSMGVLSEADYAVATTIEALRASFAGFSDGALTAAEGANEFAAQVAAVYKAVASLQAKNIPVTVENIAKEMQNLASTDAGGSIDELGKGADEAAPAVEAVTAAAGDAAGVLADTASSAQETADSMQAIGAATKAASVVSGLGSAARSATGAIQNAAYATSELADALSQIRSKNISISVSTSGFPEALNWISQLTSGLEGIPTSVHVSIDLSTSGGSGSGVGPKTPSYARSTTPPAMNFYETYNVYDPLAAEMLASQRRQATIDRMEAMMNG